MQSSNMWEDSKNHVIISLREVEKPISRCIGCLAERRMLLRALLMHVSHISANAPLSSFLGN